MIIIIIIIIVVILIIISSSSSIITIIISSSSSSIIGLFWSKPASFTSSPESLFCCYVLHMYVTKYW